MRSGVFAFIGKVLLWLIPCFAAWHVTAPMHTRAVGWAAHQMIDLYKSGIVTEVEHQQGALVFVSTIKVHPRPGETAILLPEVNPLTYTYGMALYLAMMLATRSRWWQVLAGLVALLPFQAWGVAFDLLAQVGIKMTPEIAAQAGLHDWRREFVALAYQLGLLIFPTLVPVMLWAGLSRSALPAMFQETEGADAAHRPSV